MNSRERFIKALNHEQPDRTPVDIGATAVTGISHYALHALRRALGLEDRPVKIHEPFQLLGLVEEDVLRALNIDVVGIWPKNNFFGFANSGWKKWISPQGIEVLVGERFTVDVDDEGRTYIYPKGDRRGLPSAMLPCGGYYFDNLVREEDVDEDDLDGRRDFAGQFAVLADDELEFYRAGAEHVSRETEYGSILNFGGMSIGDAAFLPGPSMLRTPGIRNIEDWYIAHIAHPGYIREIFDYQTEIAMENLKLLKEAVGDKAQAIFMSGTDFGTQRSEFMSADMFREFYKPYFRKANDWVHANTSWKTFYHSCGSIVNLLDDFVEMGADILNPVQCSASGMSAEGLKAKYGDRLTFWGGGADTQRTLPFGTPEEVKRETEDRLRIFGKGGGFIFNPVHNIQGQTPAANMTAMFGAIRDFKF